MLEPAYSFRRFLPSLLWEINDLLFAFPEKILFRKDASFNTSGKPLNVAYISGADLMITRDLFEKMGGFDPDYFLYFEETDLACRVRKHHFKILSIPDAQILHIENASFTDKCLAREHYYYGLLTYYSKHYSRIYQWIINLIIKATFITRILLFTVIGGQEKKEYWRMLSGSFYRAKLNYKSQ
jgi:hypothetical protein